MALANHTELSSTASVANSKKKQGEAEMTGTPG